METLDIVATDVVAPATPVLDLGAVALAPPDEPAVRRWPGWLRLTIVVGGAASLWVGIGWVALQVAHPG